MKVAKVIVAIGYKTNEIQMQGAGTKAKPLDEEFADAGIVEPVTK